MPKLVSERIKKLREEIAEISEANRTHKHRRDVGQPPTTNGGSNDCRKFWMSLMCGSQDLTLQAILSNGVATVRQTLRRMFSAMAAERAKKRRKLVLTPVGVEKLKISEIRTNLGDRKCPGDQRESFVGHPDAI